jgi:hypothetical protein
MGRMWPDQEQDVQTLHATNHSKATIQSLISTWKPDDWGDNILKLSSGNLDGTAKDFLTAETLKHLHKGQFGRAYNWTLLALHLSRGAMTEDAGFIDTFRPSKIPLQHLPRLPSLLQKISTTLSALQSVPPSSITKLTSIANYAEVVANTRIDRYHLLKALKAPNHPALSLLTLVEQQFSGLHARANWFSAPSNQEGIEDLALEESASAASFALDLLNKDTPLDYKQFTPFIHEGDSPEKAEGILLLAHRLRELKEMEASIFRLNYHFIKTGPAAYVYTANSDRAGMSIALGYIKNQWIAAVNEPPSEFAGAASLSSMFQLWFEKFGEQIAHVTTDKLPRIRLALPIEHVKKLGELILSNRRLFQEEIRAIHNACYELDTNFLDMEAFRITPELSLLDMLAISRLLRLIYFARHKRLLELRDSNIVAMWNSSLLGISARALIETLSAAGFSRQQAESYVNVFTWNTQNSDQFVDLQYRPFISLGAEIAIPLAVHLNSNLFRNPLITQNKRLYSDGADDPVSRHLKEALGTKTPLTLMAVKYGHQKKKGDIDVLAVLDNKLYVFECKNTILPTSTTEQQTTYDRIQRGVEQLDRFLVLWKDKEFRKLISKSTGIDLVEITTVKTAVVLSNRLFSGNSFGGHPIRHHRELASFIRHGKTTAWPPGGPPREINQWSGDEFSSSDLDDYLSDTSKLYGQLWRSFEVQDKPLMFSNTTVIKRDFVLIQEKFLAELGIDQPPLGSK